MEMMRKVLKTKKDNYQITSLLTLNQKKWQAT